MLTLSYCMVAYESLNEIFIKSDKNKQWNRDMKRNRDDRIR